MRTTSGQEGELDVVVRTPTRMTREIPLVNHQMVWWQVINRAGYRSAPRRVCWPAATVAPSAVPARWRPSAATATIAVNAATPTCWKIKSKEEEETESSPPLDSVSSSSLVFFVGVQLITLISSSPKFSAKQSNSRKPSKKRNTKILDADHGLTDHLGNDERALRLLVTNAMERKHTHTQTLLARAT